MRAKVACFIFGWLAFGLVWAADPVVSNVTVAQRAGTKLMDIGYDLAADGPVEISIRISADNGASWTVPATNVTGAVGVGITAGVSKVITWDGGTDWSGQRGAQLRVEITASAPDALYLVIDLSAGVSATSYPVTYLDGVPVGGWTAEYKTTKLVLRRIPKTSPSFSMGSPAGELGQYTDEAQHAVTLTQDFYIGVFEITQKQWNLVMGDWPSYFNNAAVRDARPVEQVSYSDIRGASAGAGWPGSDAVDAASFMGKLRQRTGLVTLDLPTESQWEYACRAGTSTALSNGTNLGTVEQDPNLDTLGRYYFNGGSGFSQGCGLANGTAAVGSYPPSVWGLYDLHGNTWEWCLDWYGTYPGTVSDPPGAAAGSIRAIRGGCWSNYASGCRSGSRFRFTPSTRDNGVGCRVAGAVEPVYQVIDLSAGATASSYPVSYLPAAPAGGWTVEYKTTKLVLRRLPKTALSFTMGSPGAELGRESDETQHGVVLTQSFYVGVFEITQKQWNLVMGDWPSYFGSTGVRDTRPVEQVSYADIRGSRGSSWPRNSGVSADSFMGRLRQRAHLLTLDLPTESQWEYACRAGTSTALNNGTSLTSVDQDANVALVGRYSHNGGSGSTPDSGLTNGTAAAGSYLPNAWGLYDMHGNVWEWCLDWYGVYPGAVTDPRGATSGSNRVARGGSWGSLAQHCRSAFRDSIGVPSFQRDDLGFRVSSAVEAYLVIDLSEGPTAGTYPVTYLDSVPAGGWTPEYKTTKLVLRRLPKTTTAFAMGSPTDELGRGILDETQHKVTLTQDFYIGVFEVTQKQWERVMGDWPSYFRELTSARSARPVEQVSYDDIRGSTLGAGWPGDSAVNGASFVGYLRERAGLGTLDLPTEAQWEYACRAGTITALNSGADLTSTEQDASMDTLGRYWYTGGSIHSPYSGLANGTAAVGSYLPNAWGLYDMHGNAYEWCLDWYGVYAGAATDPRGAASGPNRIFRGGCFSSSAGGCRSAWRNGIAPSSGMLVLGFRLAMPLP